MADALRTHRYVLEIHRWGVGNGQEEWASRQPVGFDAHCVVEVTEEDRTPRDVFVATRSAANATPAPNTAVA